MISAALLLLALQPAAPLAPPEPPCSAEDRRLPEALAGWTERVAERAVAIAPGRPARIELRPAVTVGYVVPPEREPAAGARGATLAVDVPAAGRYQVALSGRAWVDMVVGQRRLNSVRHGHGPRCSTIRKLVAFDLPAGRHLLQLSGSEESAIQVMIARDEGGATAGQR